MAIPESGETSVPAGRLDSDESSPWSAARRKVKSRRDGLPEPEDPVDRRSDRELFATSPRGVEDLLAAELRGLGAREVAPVVAGVGFVGDLGLAYRVCLWSRFASRVLMPVATFIATDSDSLYHGVTQVPWEDHLGAQGTLAVSARVRGEQFDNSHFVSLRVKDAIVDRFRRRDGVRPGVDLEDPDLFVYCFVHGDEASVGIDLAGEPLHRRGYRRRGVAAPLKENLAAALLARAGWPRLAKEGWALLDPLCGSGTLLIEAAMMATDWAPGLDRPRYGFQRWLGHREALWATLVLEAQERRQRGLARRLVIAGSDRSESAVAAARENLEGIGLGDRIVVRAEGLSLAVPPAGASPGLLITNPPWGQRLGGDEELVSLYTLLGERLREAFDGWNAAVLGPDESHLKEIGLRWFKLNKLYHGPLSCRLAHYRIGSRPKAVRERDGRPDAESSGPVLGTQR